VTDYGQNRKSHPNRTRTSSRRKTRPRAGPCSRWMPIPAC
jgi:hypothetical protein